MQYIFFICGFKDSALFNAVSQHESLRPLAECPEVLLESKHYLNLEDCEFAFADVMQEICWGENRAGAGRRVLIGRSNEGIAEVKSNINSLIDQSILYTYFIADEKSLNESSLKYNVFGCIKTVSG